MAEASVLGAFFTKLGAYEQDIADDIRERVLGPPLSKYPLRSNGVAYRLVTIDSEEFWAVWPGTTELDEGAFRACDVGLILGANIPLRKEVFAGIQATVVDFGARVVIRDCAGSAIKSAKGRATEIEASAFYGCASLESVFFPAVTHIRPRAFVLTQLTSVRFDNVRIVPIDCFHDCNALQSASFPNAVEVKKHAFDGCVSLHAVHMPLVTHIRQCAFQDCTALERIALPSIEHIYANCFFESGLIEANFNGVVDVQCFMNCGSLQRVVLPNLMTVQRHTFMGCMNLRETVLPRVRYVDESAFEGCTALLRVDLPDAKSIDEEAFKGCPASVHIPAECEVHEEGFDDERQIKRAKMAE